MRPDPPVLAKDLNLSGRALFDSIDFIPGNRTYFAATDLTR